MKHSPGATGPVEARAGRFVHLRRVSGPPRGPRLDRGRVLRRERRRRRTCRSRLCGSHRPSRRPRQCEEAHNGFDEFLLSMRGLVQDTYTLLRLFLSPSRDGRRRMTKTSLAALFMAISIAALSAAGSVFAQPWLTQIKRGACLFGLKSSWIRYMTRTHWWKYRVE